MREGAGLAPRLWDEQTVAVPPGGAAIFEIDLDRAGSYALVDHALSRMERGLVGDLIVEESRPSGLIDRRRRD